MKREQRIRFANELPISEANRASDDTGGGVTGENGPIAIEQLYAEAFKRDYIDAMAALFDEDGPFSTGSLPTSGRAIPPAGIGIECHGSARTRER
jgi:hypothetical protein